VQIGKNILSILPTMVLITIHVSCEKEAPINAGAGLEDWSEDSHSYLAEPDYARVFNPNEVQRLDIVIESEYWQAMQDDLNEKYGRNSGPNPPPVKKSAPKLLPAIPQKENPVYVPCQIFHEGKQWYDVAIRYKGNSSLSSPYRTGIDKLPFRLEFDHFENENPSISGQTFYGFSQLSFANGFKDISLIHEKVATDVYRDFGIPATHSAFYRIYVDYGEGSVYFGLYTMLEVVFDGPMLLKQFNNETGNCYKPEGPGAQFNNPAFVNSLSFNNKTNPDAGLSDVKAMTQALLSESRIQNSEKWRDDLESIFNVDLFLKWLAANTTMRNWDTYGRMSHNFYLYNTPSSGLLTWIPWDNNETFADGPGEMAKPDKAALDFDFSNLATLPEGPGATPPWPLISFLYEDPVYKQKYNGYIEEFIQGPFSVSVMSGRFNEAHQMILPYVIGPDGEKEGYTFIPTTSDFENSLPLLIDFVTTRFSEAVDYLE